MTTALEGWRVIVTLIGAAEDEVALTPPVSIEPVSSGVNPASVVKEKD